jgi:hypothetical protein
MKRIVTLLTVIGLGLIPASQAGPSPTPTPSPTATPSPTPSNTFSFEMIPSAGLPTTLQKAKAKVIVHSQGPTEVMEVFVCGLPANTDFDFFIIQQPAKPFGLSWYQGDINTDDQGKGFALFIGRFSIETFIVSPGTVAAPVVFENAFPDSDIGTTVGRVHTYHCGLWFNSPADALKAGAPGTVTPFNGEGNAGVQVLNTANFPDLAGPLINVE